MCFVCLQHDSGAEFAAHFPNFLWIVRDFAVRLERDGRRISSRDYLEDSLKPEAGTLPFLTELCHRGVPTFWTYGSVCCACAQRLGLPRVCHSALLACLALQAVLSAPHVACAPHTRLRQSFLRTLRSQTT
jgi:hypothetical protein